jgi:hypothetical protein
MKDSRSFARPGLAAATLALALLWHTPGYGLEPEQILAWVAGQMTIADPGPMPVVHYVDKAELQAAFTKANHNTYRRWEDSLGAQEAKQIFNGFLQELVGMFDPETQSIYVGRFLPPCRREAILAHELTHYFQVRRNGRVDPDRPGADRIQSRLEMQASTIEMRYSDLFGANQGIPNTTAAPREHSDSR